MAYEPANELANRQIVGLCCEAVVEKGIYNTVKRIIDILLALIGLFISIPTIIVLSAAIMIESKGPAIYKQERLGRKGRPFIIYKMRSMFINAEEEGPKWADKCDHRVTKVGRFIRKCRLDEIPQLFNILKGDMSIVGPRPERPHFFHKFNQDIPGFLNRLQVKPGLTGWAQVNGGYDITPEQKLRLDMEYIENMCLLLDLKIIWRTIIIVLTGYGAR